MEISIKHVLIILFILGLSIRYHASVYNLIPERDSITAFDETVSMLIAIGTVSSPWQRLSTLYHGPIYFYLTDIGYKLFGVTYAGARLFSTILSTTSIALVYLLAREFYGKRIALFSAAIFTISSAQILLGTLALYEPLYTAFILASLLSFVRWIRSSGQYYLFASVAFFVVAFNTKIIVFYLLPIYAYYLLSRKKRIARGDTKYLLLAAIMLVFLLLLLPIPTYNFLLYMDKGIIDLNLARTFNLSQPLNYFRDMHLALADTPWLQPDIGSSAVAFAGYFISIFSPAFIFLALAGTYAMLSKRTPADFFVLLWFGVPVFLYILLTFHLYYLVFLVPPFAIMAARGIEYIAVKVPPIEKKLFVFILFALLVANELLILAEFTKDKSTIYKLKEFVAKIPTDAILLSDPKIINLQAFWLFEGLSGQSAQYFTYQKNELYKYTNATDDVFADMYYITCELENCGLDVANLADVKELSDTYKEEIISKGLLVTEIYENGLLAHRIYRTKVAFPHALPFYLKNYIFYGYRIDMPEFSQDVYDIPSGFPSFLNILAHLSLLVNLIFALSMPFLALYLLHKEPDEKIRSVLKSW